MFKIPQFVPENRCLSCKICCRFSQKSSLWQPTILEQERESIFKDSTSQETVLPSGRIKTRPHNQGFLCLFFDLPSNRCKIYERRPFECRLYPFLINKQENHLYLAIHLNCPFITEQLDSIDFNDYLSYLNDFLRLPENAQKIRQNLNRFANYTDEHIRNLLPLDKAWS
jgi:Fe-S-cluster containining protein